MLGNALLPLPGELSLFAVFWTFTRLSPTFHVFFAAFLHSLSCSVVLFTPFIYGWLVGGTVGASRDGMPSHARPRTDLGQLPPKSCEPPLPASAATSTGMHGAGLWGEVGHMNMQCVFWCYVRGYRARSWCVGSTLCIWRSQAQ